MYDGWRCEARVPIGGDLFVSGLGVHDIYLIKQSLGPKVMIVGVCRFAISVRFRTHATAEEAGQVLEAHVLASLIDSIQHLVLIGDPFQLRPNLNNFGEYSLLIEYNLSSLRTIASRIING